MTDARQPELFTTGAAAPVDVAPGSSHLRSLARSVPSRVLLGTSSWAFPGWAGRVYDREVTERVLAAHGLTAYARHPLLRCVGLDRGYYRPLDRATLERYRDQSPEAFRFVLKADRRLVFPGGPGSDPEVFLSAPWARDRVVGPAQEVLGPRLGSVLFQFPPLDPGAVGGPRRFAERLFHFLDALEAGPRYCVELRTPALLTRDYAGALEHGGAGHGYVVHPEMSGLSAQASVIPPRTGDTHLIRWMLHRSFTYRGARDAWAPFTDLRRPDPESREEVAQLATRIHEEGGTALVVVNNKAEGSSPASVEALARVLARPHATD